MRQENRPVWIAEDNSEWPTETECKAHERELHSAAQLEQARNIAEQFMRDTYEEREGKGAARIINVATKFYTWLESRDLLRAFAAEDDSSEEYGQSEVA